MLLNDVYVWLETAQIRHIRRNFLLLSDSQGRILTSLVDLILVDQLCREPVERGQIIALVLVEPGGADGQHSRADVVLKHLGYPMVALTVRVSEQSGPCVHQQPFVQRNVSRQSSGH